MTDEDDDNDEVYVGDRYVSGDDGIRITITSVDGNFFEYSYMGADHSRVYHTRAVLPVPTTWTKVGSSPKPVLMCGHCGKAPAEPLMVLCWTCIAMQASQWATLSEEDAKIRTINLGAAMPTSTEYRRKPVEELETDDE